MAAVLVATLALGAVLTAAGPKPAADARPLAAKPYFVEFRARTGELVGHTFVVYGRTNGDPRDVTVAGLYPKSRGKNLVIVSPRSPIRGGVKDDRAQPVTAVYRRLLTTAEFTSMRRAIARMRGSVQVWHLVFLNCNDFAGEIAESIGLRRPPSLMRPHDYVMLLRALNG